MHPHAGSAVRYGNAAQDPLVPGERNQNTNEQTTVQRISAMNISRDKNADGVPVHGKEYPLAILATRMLLLSYLLNHMVLFSCSFAYDMGLK